MEQYKQEYQNYVDNLPEDEKRKILQQARRKKGRGRTSSGRSRKTRKRKPVPKPVPEPPKPKFTEPEQPPM